MATLTMKPSSIPVWVVTLLLHLALLEALVSGFSDNARNINANQSHENVIEAQFIQASESKARVPAAANRVNEPHEVPVTATTAPEAATETKANPEPPATQTSAAQSDAGQQKPASDPPVVNSGPTVNAAYVATEAAKWYPSLSKKYGEEGTVILRAFISAAGRCEKVEIKKSSNFQLLDDTAIALAKSLIYRPAIVNGQPISEWLDFPVVFRLSKH